MIENEQNLDKNRIQKVSGRHKRQEFKTFMMQKSNCLVTSWVCLFGINKMTEVIPVFALKRLRDGKLGTWKEE